jgi:hypothetical protein
VIKQIISQFRSATNFSTHGEVALFRELASAIQTNTKSVFIDETHGPKKCNVRFVNCLGAQDRCEISDLLIITFLSKDKPLRATFWQAKKEPKSEWASSKSKVRQLDFQAQFNQWDLLARRPKISGAEKFSPPKNLLSGATSSSIGSFGTFYERNGVIEVFHSVAEFVCCKNPNAKHPMFISNGLLGRYQFSHQEAITRVKLREFLAALLGYQIGSLLLPTSPADVWLAKYAQSKASQMGVSIDPDFFSLYDRTSIDDQIDASEDGISVLFVHAGVAV